MGITGLLPCLKDITKIIYLREYKGKKVAVDGYVWLHRGAYSCSRELCLGQKTDKYVVYCVGWVKLLLANGVIPVIVFDGDRLPQKAVTEEQRKRSRDQSLERAQAYLKNGNYAAAEDCFKKAVDINPVMAKNFIVQLERLNVEYIVAPYEADAQMAYLAINNLVHAVITEDSDLLVYGCPRVLFKLDKDGKGKQICLGDLSKNKNPPFSMFTHQMFVEMCILSGCDFLNSVPGIGINKAHHHIRTARGFVKAVKQMKLRGISVPGDYLVGVQLAMWVFKHQRVYCPEKKQIVHLQDIPDRGLIDSDMHVADALPKAQDADTLHFLGPPMQHQLAAQIAQGQVDPITKLAFREEDLNELDNQKKVGLSGKFLNDSGRKKVHTSGDKRRSGVQNGGGGAIFKYFSSKPFKVPRSVVAKDNIDAANNKCLTENHPLAPKPDNSNSIQAHNQSGVLNSTQTQKQQLQQLFSRCDENNSFLKESGGKQEDACSSQLSLFQQMLKKIDKKADQNGKNKDEGAKFHNGREVNVQKNITGSFEDKNIDGKIGINCNDDEEVNVLKNVTGSFEDQNIDGNCTGQKNNEEKFIDGRLKNSRQQCLRENFQSGNVLRDDFSNFQNQQFVSFDGIDIGGKSREQKNTGEKFQNENVIQSDDLNIQSRNQVFQSNQFSDFDNQNQNDCSNVSMFQSRVQNRFCEDQESFFNAKQAKNPNLLNQNCSKQVDNNNLEMIQEEKIRTPLKQFKSVNNQQSNNLNEDGSPSEKWRQQLGNQNQTFSVQNINNIGGFYQDQNKEQQNICLRQTVIQSQQETPKVKCVLEKFLGIKRKKTEDSTEIFGEEHSNDALDGSPPGGHKNNDLNQDQNCNPNNQNKNLNDQNSLLNREDQFNDQNNLQDSNLNNQNNEQSNPFRGDQKNNMGVQIQQKNQLSSEYLQIEQNTNNDLVQCMDKKQQSFFEVNFDGDLNQNENRKRRSGRGFSSQSFSLNFSCGFSQDSEINSCYQQKKQQILCNNQNNNYNNKNDDTLLFNDGNDDINIIPLQLDFPSSQSQQNNDEIIDQKNSTFIGNFDNFRFDKQQTNQTDKKPSRLYKMLHNNSKQLNISSKKTSLQQKGQSILGDKLSQLLENQKMYQIEQQNYNVLSDIQKDNQIVKFSQQNRNQKFRGDLKRQKLNIQSKNNAVRRIQFNDDNNDDVAESDEEIQKENQCLRNPLTQQQQQKKQTYNQNSFFQQFSFQNNENQNNNFDRQTEIQTICSSRAFLHEEGKFENIRHVGKYSKIAAKVVRDLQLKHFQMHNIPVPVTTNAENAHNNANVQHAQSADSDQIEDVENIAQVSKRDQMQTNDVSQHFQRQQLFSEKKCGQQKKKVTVKKRGKIKTVGKI